MNDSKGGFMSYKRFLWAAVLATVVAAGLSTALAGASWRSGSHVGASWVSGADPETDAPAEA